MDDFSTLISIISGILTSIALLAGGLWAIYRLKIQREHTSNPQVKMDHTLLPYGNDLKLLVITAHIRNIGKICVNVERIVFALKKLPDDKQEGETLNWNDGTFLVTDFDVVKESNPEDISNKYMIEPGDEYDECITAVVPSQALLMSRIEFQGKEGDHFWVYKVFNTQISKNNVSSGS